MVQERAKSSLVNPKRGGRGTKAIHLHKKEKTGDEDLVEFAAIQTLLNGGTVYLVEPEKRFG